MKPSSSSVSSILEAVCAQVIKCNDTQSAEERRKTESVQLIDSFPPPPAPFADGPVRVLMVLFTKVQTADSLQVHYRCCVNAPWHVCRARGRSSGPAARKSPRRNVRSNREFETYAKDSLSCPKSPIRIGAFKGVGEGMEETSRVSLICVSFIWPRRIKFASDACVMHYQGRF